MAPARHALTEPTPTIRDNATMTDRPLIVLVHGAWHGAWCWAGLQAALDRRGIASLAVDLPGHGASLLPHSDLYGHADHVAAVVARHPGPVVLVGHSYGGAVISEAATRHSDNVAHLVYMAAFCLDAGESVMAIVTGLPADPVALAAAIVPGPDEGLTHLDPERAPAALYADCDGPLVEAAVARLGTQAMATFVQPATGAPWYTIPSTYLLCTRDEAVHPAHQHHMAQRCAHVVSMATDHSPFASRTEETAELLAGIVAGLDNA
jgi:pimeloyl-ACP methyl ester carboxylesterase